MRIPMITALPAVLLALLLPAPALHAHSDAPAAPSAASVIEPRVEAASPDVELLGIVEGTRLIVYLDRFATNEPIDGAKLTLERGTDSASAEALGDGVYRFELSWLAEPGQHALLFTVITPELSDLLTATLDLSAMGGNAAEAAAAWPRWMAWLAGAGVDVQAGAPRTLWLAGTVVALVVLILLIVVVRARRHRHRGALAGALLVALALAGSPPPPAFAHEAAPAPSSANPRQPSRLADGSVFVPMAAQRALGLRTRIGESTTVPVSVELTGTVVADPAASGQVQAPVAGRIEPGPGGLPYAGQRVARGAVLAWIVPTVGVVERSNQQAQLADLDAQLEIARARTARYDQLVGSIPQRDIDAARTEASSLAQRRAAVAGGLGGRVALVAPVAGVVSTAAAASGQVVDARDLLFRVVDPSRLMVEALAYDPALAADLTGGSALATDGRTVPLAWVGSAGQLREQALPMLFRVRGTDTPLVVGERLRVIATTRRTTTGVVLPANSLTRAANGESVVWTQASAERFEPARVVARPLDGDRIVVTSGLQPGQRVVTQAASLLAQIR
jgi:hypothetical protein